MRGCIARRRPAPLVSFDVCECLSEAHLGLGATGSARAPCEVGVRALQRAAISRRAVALLRCARARHTHHREGAQPA